jgi:hypothetical protein
MPVFSAPIIGVRTIDGETYAIALELSDVPSSVKSAMDLSRTESCGQVHLSWDPDSQKFIPIGCSGSCKGKCVVKSKRDELEVYWCSCDAS